jgi:glycosyltransferase involved in cell wall biosynthesis
MQKDTFKVRKFPDLSSFQAESCSHSLRVCIATEEIVGPVRNGGIASTYYHLARMLVEDGHKVTVLYLKGHRVENETVEHWIEWYRNLGIDFVPLPFDSVTQHGISPFWQCRYYAFYRWLDAQEPFDIVHTSEWRGGAFYVLGAKRMGLSFENTLFLVKSSSPHIWNRHYQMRTIENDNMLACSYAEQKTIEWADIVIGGSAHLLSFMEYMGYRLPESRLFVQPNVFDLQDLDVEEGRPKYKYGEQVQSRELVFFGRLEARKGLEIFCDALDQIVDAGGDLPEKVFFLGKQGQNMPSNPAMPNINYIHQKAKFWPFEIEIITDRDQREAIGFLCSRPRIAVMPSLIENSTMTIYEALAHRIPFLATAVGGTPELIDAEFHDRTLTDPQPGILAEDLARILNTGGTVAKPAFDNSQNYLVWRRFHAWLSCQLSEHSVADVIDTMAYDSSELLEDPRPARKIVPSRKVEENTKESVFSVIIYHYDDPAGLRLTLNSVIEQEDFIFNEVLVITDGAVSSERKSEYQLLKENMVKVCFMEVGHQCIGSCLNLATNEAEGDIIVYLTAGLHVLKSYAGNLVRDCFKHPHIKVACAIYDHVEEVTKKDRSSLISDFRYLPLGGDIASHVMHDGTLGGKGFIAKRDMVQKLGGFIESYHVSHVETEFMARCVLSGEELWVIPHVLYESLCGEKLRGYNVASGRYLRLKPIIDNSSCAMKRLFLRLGQLHGTDTPAESFGKMAPSVSRFNVLNTAIEAEPWHIRMGIVIEQDSGIIISIIRRPQSTDENPFLKVSVQGRVVANIPFEEMGPEHLTARWKCTIKSPPESMRTIAFTCDVGEQQFKRVFQAIWGSDNCIYIATKLPIVSRKELDISELQKILPRIPHNWKNIRKQGWLIKSRIKKLLRGI